LAPTPNIFCHFAVIAIKHDENVIIGGGLINKEHKRFRNSLFVRVLPLDRTLTTDHFNMNVHFHQGGPEFDSITFVSRRRINFDSGSIFDY